MGRQDPRGRGEVGRGPARALHLLRPRAWPAPAGAGRLRRRRAAARPRREVLARQRGLHAIRDHRPDHHLHPAARSLQAGRVPLRVLVALHQHGPRHALPRGGAPAGVLRDGAHHGRHRRRAGPGPRRGALAQLHPPRRDALRPRAAVPGRTAAEVRLRRLPCLPRQAQGPGRLGRLRRLPRPCAGRGTQGGARDRLLRRGHRCRPLRGWTHPDRDQRPGQRVDRSDLAGAGPRDGIRPGGCPGARRADRGRLRHDR